MTASKQKEVGLHVSQALTGHGFFSEILVQEKKNRSLGVYYVSGLTTRQNTRYLIIPNGLDYGNQR